MSSYVVWIDREHARIFEFSQEKMERKTIQAHHVDHHSHAADMAGWRERQGQEWRFFEEVRSCLVDVERLLILGPGVAKHHFRSYLSDHFPAIARKMVGCETVDHPSDPQIAAYAQRFFKLGTTGSPGPAPS